MKGENINIPNHRGKSPARSAHKDNAAARNPSVEDPVSPMKIRAGGKFHIRNPAAAAAITKDTAV
jgi:hypothetical protein